MNAMTHMPEFPRSAARYRKQLELRVTHNGPQHCPLFTAEPHPARAQIRIRFAPWTKGVGHIGRTTRNASVITASLAEQLRAQQPLAATTSGQGQRLVRLGRAIPTTSGGRLKTGQGPEKGRRTRGEK